MFKGISHTTCDYQRNSDKYYVKIWAEKSADGDYKATNVAIVLGGTGTPVRTPHTGTEQCLTLTLTLNLTLTLSLNLILIQDSS